MDYLSVFKMPVPMKITGISSSVTNAFVNSIIPVIAPSEKDIKESLEILGMDTNTIECIYCGSKYTEWDHLRPLVFNKRPTGYISEIQNLVPCCGKCNQSKGNKEWMTWIKSDAKLSPNTKKILDLDLRINKLTSYAKWREATKIDFPTITGEKLWSTHWGNCEYIHEAMIEAQKVSTKIKKEIEGALNVTNQEIYKIESTTSPEHIITKPSKLNQKFTKIHRIKLWARRKHQNNHKIIKSFLLAEQENKVVTYQSMAKFCNNKEDYPDLHVNTMPENFAQMKSDSSNSHGKVFYEEGNRVLLFPEVRVEVKKYFY